MRGWCALDRLTEGPPHRVARSAVRRPRLHREGNTVRAASIPRGESVPLSKPEGGYQLIPTVHLALAWWAYHENLIRLADLRVWFAAWEMRARRCRAPSPLPHRFGLGELAQLTGLAPRRLKAALRRLEAARLLSWSEAAIGFPAPAEALVWLDGDGFRRFFDRMPNHRRFSRRRDLPCRHSILWVARPVFPRL